MKRHACFAVVEIDRYLGTMAYLVRNLNGYNLTEKNPFAAFLTDAETADELVERFSADHDTPELKERYCVSKLKMI